MAAATAILIAGILALTWQLRSEMNANYRLMRDVRELRSQLADKSQHEQFELQKECSLQAAKVFSQLGWSLSEVKNGSTASFESHYNAEMNKCFMLLHIVTFSTGAAMESTLLSDAYAQREYATLNLTSGSSVKPIFGCSLTPLHGDERKCATEAEFKSFVAGYMEAMPKLHP